MQRAESLPLYRNPAPVRDASARTARRSSTRRWWLAAFHLYIWSAVLAPYFPGSWFRPDDVILAVLVAPIAARVLITSKLVAPRWLFLSILSFLVLPLLVFLVILVLGSSSEVSPTKEIFRALKYLSLLVVFCHLDSVNIRGVVRSLLLASLVAVAVLIMQHWNLYGINQFMAAYFSGPEQRFDQLIQTQSQYGVSHRSFGTFHNPNGFANFLVVPLFLSVFSLAAGQRPPGGSRKDRLILISIPVIATALVLTESRTAFVALTVGMLAAFAVVGRATTAMKLLGLSTVLLITFAIVGDLVGFDRFASLLSFRSDAAFEEKLPRVLAIVSSIFGAEIWRVLIGYGSGYRTSVAADFEYGYLLLWYGLVGVFAYFGVVVAAGSIALRSRSSSELRLACFALAAAMPVFALTETTFINNRVFPFFLLVFALTYVSSRNQSRHRRSQVSGSSPAGLSSARPLTDNQS